MADAPRATDDLLQHIVDVSGANVLYLKVAYVRVYVLIDAAVQNIRVFSSSRNLALEMLCG